MEKLFEGIGTAIGNMPPAGAAVVILALAAMGLVYVWRKSGEEAKREKARADDAQAKAEAAYEAGISAQLGSLISGQEKVLSDMGTIKSDLRVLLERGHK
jgi:hypothetical protein